MQKIQLIRIISILGAFLVGFWIPIRLIGYTPPLLAELGFCLVVCMVAGFNIYLHFQKTRLNPRQWQSWKSFGLVVDLICLLPVSLVALIFFDQTITWILVLNLLCARHIRHIKIFLDQYDSLQPIAYRLIPIFLSLPLLVHLVSCGWIVLGSGSAGLNPDPVLTYVKAIYWAFTTLTTVGYGDIVAQTIPQMLYCCFTQVIGVGVFGFILSNVASLISRSDAAREHHMDNLDKIETFMKNNKIPGELKSKTRAYYHYLWMTKQGYQNNSLIEDLPHKLQSELFLFINRSIVEKVPFLKGADPDMIEDLMDQLESRIFVPGERIFRIDEPGECLYFVQSGNVEILSRDGSVLANLSDGAFFGEIALLTDKPRGATARARGFCDIYLLHRDAFHRVAEAYPEFKSHMHDSVQSRQVG